MFIASKGGDDHRSDFGPTATFNAKIISDTELTPEQITDLGSKQSHLYCFGLIEYVDAFGRNRYVRFRHQIGGTDIPDGTGMPPSAEGNHSN